MADQATIYEQVTARIIEQLEKGVVPWRRPWATVGGGMSLNVVSDKPYRGVNVWLLSLAAEANGWDSNLYGTFGQWRDLGGYVRRGQHGTRIVYWHVETVQEDQQEKRRFFCRTYIVFNLDQCGGAALDSYREKSQKIDVFPDFGPAEQAIAATKARIIYGGSQAFYSTDTDHIALPYKECFDQPEDYYSTALHELAHWTGHSSRLDRLNTLARFGDNDYAIEELVAEMASSFLTATLGIRNSAAQERSASYVANWLDVLKNDRRALFSASSAASKASDFVLAFSRETAVQEAEPCNH